MDGFPEAVRKFVAENISSVEHLEALLLLRSQPMRAWSAADLSRELYIGLEPAAARLSGLEAQGLLVRVPGPCYHYRPRNPVLDLVVAELAELYKVRRHAIIALIYSQPPKYVQSFADAFRLRKEQ